MRHRGFVPLAAVLLIGQSMAVYKGRGSGSRIEDFVGKWPAYGRITFRGDNVEAGDFFPLGSCDVVVLVESRHVYRVLAH